MPTCATQPNVEGSAGSLDFFQIIQLCVMQGNNITMLVSACFVFLLGFCVHLNKGRKILIILKRTISFELNYREVVVIFGISPQIHSFSGRGWIYWFLSNWNGKTWKESQLNSSQFQLCFFYAYAPYLTMSLYFQVMKALHFWQIYSTRQRMSKRCIRLCKNSPPSPMSTFCSFSRVI